MLKVETVDIKGIHEKLNELNINVARAVVRFDMHAENQAIHQNPPCKAHQDLANRLYGVAVLAIGGLITAVWGVFSKGH